VADVRPSINVFFPHCIKLCGEKELLSSVIEHGKMKIVVSFRMRMAVGNESGKETKSG
jgi:hypothetical protein